MYGRHCAQCHGVQGEGDADRAVPALAAQRFTYLVRQLAEFSGNARSSTPMHAVLSQPALQDPQKWADLAGYLVDVPPTSGLREGNGAHLGLGRGIFHEQCTGCHLPDARGDLEGFVPSLRNQNFPYLLAQLRRMSTGSRHNMDEDLVRFLRSFSDDDMQATADYLSRLKDTARVPTSTSSIRDH